VRGRAARQEQVGSRHRRLGRGAGAEPCAAVDVLAAEQVDRHHDLKGTLGGASARLTGTAEQVGAHGRGESRACPSPLLGRPVPELCGNRCHRSHPASGRRAARAVASAGLCERGGATGDRGRLARTPRGGQLGADLADAAEAEREPFP
jgi:hypothetical protein